MRQTSYAYLAAAIDGEGCLTITQSKYKDNTKPKQRGVHYICKIQVTNTDRRMLDWIASQFGGNVFVHCRRKGRPWKDSFRWVLWGHKVQESTILAILPYLILKREQAKILLEFLRMNGEQNPAKRKTLKERINLLNRRGVSPETNTPTASNEVMIEPVPDGDIGSAVIVM